MRSNPYTGDVPLDIKGWPSLVLRFDWDAIAEVQSAYAGKTLGALLGSDVGTLLELAAIGLKRHHPDMTVEDLKKLPTAMLPLKNKVAEALMLAHEGPDAGKAKPANPPSRAARRAAARQAKKTLSGKR